MSRFSNPLRRRYKIIGYSLTWIVALLATNPTFGLLPLLYMFPSGLSRMVLPSGTDDSGWRGWAIYGVCVGVYVVQAIFFFCAKNLRSTLVWLVVLVILLVVNVAGCHDMIHAH